MDELRRNGLESAMQELERLVENGLVNPDAATLAKNELERCLERIDHEHEKFVGLYKLRGMEELHSDLIKELQVAEKTKEAQNLISRLARQIDSEVSRFSERGAGRFDNDCSLSNAISPCCNSYSTLPKFNGEWSQWYPFWHTFSVLVGEKSIPNIEKLGVLLAHLEGEAKLSVSHYTVCEESYEPVVDCLKRRYDQPEMQMGNSLRELIRLGQANRLPDLIKGRKLLMILAHLERFNAELRTVIHLVADAAPSFMRERLVSESIRGDLRSLREIIVILEDELRARENLVPSRDDVSRDSSGYAGRAMNQHSQVRSHLEVECVFCQARNHKSEKCRTLSDTGERKKFVIKSGLCFRCLQRGHRAHKCMAKSCQRCHGTHHVALCEETKTIACNYSAEVKKEASSVLLMSFRAKVENPLDVTKVATVTILIDPGSEASFIDERLVKRLHLLREEISQLQICTFAHRPLTKITQSVRLGIHGERSVLNINAYIMQRWVAPIRRVDVRHIDITKLKHSRRILQSVSLERPMIVIGMDSYHSIVKQEPVKLKSDYFFYRTDFGNFVTGNGQQPVVDSPKKQIQMNSIRVDSFDLSEFWKLENLGIELPEDKTADDYAVKHFKETVKKVEEGRYEVSFPWKNGRANVPNNFGLAMGRLRSTLSNLKSRQMIEQYDGLIREQEEAQIIEEVPISVSEEGNISYIPHHAVINSRKLRIVYDASARTKGKPSINSLLCCGPTQLENIFGILLRSRFLSNILIADVEKAFHQIRLNADDRDVTRFLWLRNVYGAIERDNLRVLRFCRVPFGFSCSPFSLSSTINHHFKNSNSEIGAKILENIYVDNVLLEVDPEVGTNALSGQLKKEFSDIGMAITAFASNDIAFMNALPEEERTRDWKNCCSLLGMQWNMHSDQFALQLPKPMDLSSKRKLLSWVASRYDPLGIMFPILVKFKNELQNLWQLGLDWDEELPLKSKERLEIAAKEWDEEPIFIPRCIGSLNEGKISLHAFADASGICMATCIYLRIETEAITNVQLLASKGRIMPVMRLTIPRAELVAVCLANRLLHYVETSLKLSLSREQRTIWTDATVVLYWLKSRANLSKMRFIQNRLLELDNFEGNFTHVPSNHNPADLASRGTSPIKLSNSRLWWNGPEFLKGNPNEWPKNPVINMDEVRKIEEIESAFKRDKNPAWKRNEAGGEVSAYTISLISNEENFVDGLMHKYRSYDKVVKIVVYVKRFVTNIRRNQEGTFGSTVSRHRRCEPISANERREAKRFLIAHAQRMTTLTEKKARNLILEDGIFMIKGRVGSKLIYLPKNSDLTRLIAMDIHRDMYHASPETVNIRFRQEFWAPKAFCKIKSIINQNCRSCFLDKARVFREPEMCSLPEARTAPSRPFEHIGLDVAGPFCIRYGEGITKRWILLSTCFTTRAVHLEVLQDMTGYTFLLAL